LVAGIANCFIMLISFKEQVIDNFLIPSFTLSQGEIVIIHVPGGPFFQPVSMKIIDIVTGKTPNANSTITVPLRYAEHVKDNSPARLLLPMTVGRYLKKTANTNSMLYGKIYEIAWMKPGIKINTLAGTVRRKLSIYATLSWTNNIVFDLVGVDPLGGQEIYSFIKTTIQLNGAAILVDSCDDFRDDCTTFVEAKYLGHW